ncbi:MAG: helix-turn-helix domain-containing protein [Ferruginibacter sp.]
MNLLRISTSTSYYPIILSAVEAAMPPVIPSLKQQAVHFRFHYTRHPRLRDLLEGFYIFETSPGNESMEYVVFPSNHIVLSIFKNTGYNIGETGIEIKESAATPFLSLLTFNVDRPTCCRYTGSVKEICFCFKPLGFNHFIDNTLKEHYREGSIPFSLSLGFENEMLALLETTDEQALQEKAEWFWLSQLKEKNLTQAEAVVQMLLQNPQTDISVIAAELSVSRQHIARLFDTHLCKTPSAFRKIARFRETLQNRVRVLRQEENLTALTYESFFYDQSHLIKDFKKLTGMSPRTFFKGNRAFENGNINWFFPG